MPRRKLSDQDKPLVFLSHSSSDRRALVALKNLLDQRAGGCLRFFLSSDDDSISPGTIWPTEVRRALDKMSLMLIFASDSALKSGWTYFEAGYGLCRTDAASVYCLPGQDRGKLPAPFNVLQNRNLHSSKDLGLLIRHINDALGVRLNDSVARDEFDKIFRRPQTIEVASVLGLKETVASIHLTTDSKPKGFESFVNICKAHQLPITIQGEWKGHWSLANNSKEWYTNWTNKFNHAQCCHTTGVSLAFQSFAPRELLKEIVVDRQTRQKGYCYTERSYGAESMQAVSWDRIGEEWEAELEYRKTDVAALEAYNSEIRVKNERLRQINRIQEQGPFGCEFVISPRIPQVSALALNEWLQANRASSSIVVNIAFHPQVSRDDQINRVSAKLHDSSFSITEKGQLAWHDGICISFEKGTVDNPVSNSLLEEALVARVTGFESFAESKLEALVGALFETEILSMRVSQRTRSK